MSICEKLQEMKTVFLMLIVFMGSIPTLTRAQNTNRSIPFTLEDRDRLIRLEEKVTLLQKQIEMMQKQMEMMQKQIEMMQQNMMTVQRSNENRFERIENLLQWVIGTFMVGFVSIIGFILWDRRTFIKPFEKKAEEVDETKHQIKQLIQALRELSYEDEKLAKVLKEFHFL